MPPVEQGPSQSTPDTPRRLRTRGRAASIDQISIAGLLSDEVLGLGVMADDGCRCLLRVELEPLADLDPDAIGTEQINHLGVVLQVGTCRVAPRISAAAVFLAEQSGQGGSVFVGVSQFLPDPMMPVFSQ